MKIVKIVIGIVMFRAIFDVIFRVLLKKKRKFSHPSIQQTVKDRQALANSVDPDETTLAIVPASFESIPPTRE